MFVAIIIYCFICNLKKIFKIKELELGMREQNELRTDSSNSNRARTN